MSDSAKVAHQARRAGVKADRKREREKAKTLMGVKADPNQPKNLKAFTFSSVISAQKDRIRRAELETKKMRNYMDRKDIVARPPPSVVAVVGPPGSGKSTLIKCLVKHFTRSPAFDCVGPVTVTVGSTKRVTFIEVPNDMGAMIDSAKVADLVILTIDGSFGFEMETFEYLNILKTHGFPRVIGVLTHMDHFRSNTSLSSVKRQMKKRFWQEVCDGAKLFHVSGLINGKYPHREILNIGRYVSIINPRPQAYRNEHSYILSDRVEDLTHPGLLKDNPICDRTVAFYGYVRGTSMKPGTNIHLLGVGDFQIQDLEKLDDPLPLLSHYKDKTSEEALEKRRSLKKQDKRVHAPFSSVGSVLYDKDAVYIKMRSNKVRIGDTNEIFTPKGVNAKTIDQGLKEDYKISLFKDSKSITALQFDALRKQREGISEFPEDLVEESDDDGEMGGRNDGDDQSTNEGDDDDDDELLAGAKQANNVYDRMSVQEFTDTSGRVRRRVVFDGDTYHNTDPNTAMGDNDGDDDFDVDDIDDIGGMAGDGDDDDDELLDDDGYDDDDEAASAAYYNGDDEDGEASMGDDEDEDDDDDEDDEDDEDPIDSGDGDSTIDHIDNEEESIDTTTVANYYKSGTSSSSGFGAETGGSQNDSNDDSQDDDDGDGGDSDDDFFVMRHKVRSIGAQQRSTNNMDDDRVFSAGTTPYTAELEGDEDDTSFVTYNKSSLIDFSDESQRDLLRDRFVTGDWHKANQKLTSTGDSSDKDEDDSDNDGNIAKVAGHDDDSDDDPFSFGGTRKRAKNQSDSYLDENDDFQSMVRDEVLLGDFEELGSNDDGDDNQDTDGDAAVRKRLEMKLKQKQGFFEQLEKEAQADEGNDDNTHGKKKVKLSKAIIQEQYDYFQAKRDELMKRIKERDETMAELTSEEQLTLFGAIPGTYVRIVLTEVPCEFIEHFNPIYPIVIGALQPTEQNLGFLNLRVKKHRWHHRLLKSNDPLIFSIGWRRFQSIPVYYVEDVTGRQRYLKYTPEHLHCLATMYAPMTAINTGVIAFKNVYLASKTLDSKATVSHFRVALTGVVLEVDKKVEVKKKLKLIGYPFQIFKKTAYIQGMFNSSIEVAKFENSRIQTVSGIPGRIVKAVTHEGKEGIYRANFNDRILKSDVIILKTFTIVKLYKYYNPVTSLLLQDKTQWKGMRTHKEMRADHKIPIIHSSDNEYKDIERGKRKFNALRIPVSLASALPFKTLDKSSSVSKAGKEKTAYQKQRTAFLDKRDTRKESFVGTIQNVSSHLAKKRKESEANRDKRRFNETRENARKIQTMKKEQKKKRYIALGKRHAENL